MFRSVLSRLRVIAWRTGLQVLGPTSQHTGSMPTSVFGTIPALQETPKTSKPLALRMEASVLDSLSRPTQVAIPILR